MPGLPAVSPCSHLLGAVTPGAHTQAPCTQHGGWHRLHPPSLPSLSPSWWGVPRAAQGAGVPLTCLPLLPGLHPPCTLHPCTHPAPRNPAPSNLHALHQSLQPLCTPSLHPHAPTGHTAHPSHPAAIPAPPAPSAAAELHQRPAAPCAGPVPGARCWRGGDTVQYGTPTHRALLTPQPWLGEGGRGHRWGQDQGPRVLHAPGCKGMGGVWVPPESRRLEGAAASPSQPLHGRCTLRGSCSAFSPGTG